MEHKEDSLNNRFKPLEGPHTDTIFAVDDDIRVPCVQLSLGYEVWQNSPRNIIGFIPRLHLRGASGYVYRCWWRVWWQGTYSIILTKAAFLHHDYFNMYTNVMPKEI
jgi:Glycosyl transferase family 64 domain